MTQTWNGVILMAVLVSAMGFFTMARANVRLHLNNGDSVSGDLVKESKESIRLKSDLLGEVTIARSSVQRIENLADAKPEKKPSAPIMKESPAPPSILGETESKSRSRSFFRLPDVSDWTKRLEFGLIAQQGKKDRSDFSFRYNMKRSSQKNRYRFEAKYFYGQTNGVTSSDKLTSYYRWRRDIAPGIFYETNSIYSFDQVKEIDHNFEQKMGLGYRFINTDVMKLSTGAGASGRYRKFHSDPDDLNYLIDIFEDWSYQLNERFRLTQDLRIATPLEDAEEYELDFKVAVVSEITDSINLTVRYELGYDNSLAKDRREDQRLVSSIGYDF